MLVVQKIVGLVILLMVFGCPKEKGTTPSEDEGAKRIITLKKGSVEPTFVWLMKARTANGDENWQIRATFDKGTSCPTFDSNDKMTSRGGYDTARYPILVCQWDVPEGIDEIHFASSDIRIPRNPGSLYIVGNTGFKGSPNESRYPAVVTDMIATSKHTTSVPLFLHTGGMNFGNDTWSDVRSQFFEPSGGLLHYPWIFLRGPSDRCEGDKEGEGWRLLFAPEPYHRDTRICSRTSTPYLTSFGYARLAVVDNSHKDEEILNKDVMTLHEIIARKVQKDPLWKNVILATSYPLWALLPHCDRANTSQVCSIQFSPAPHVQRALGEALASTLNPRSLIVISGGLNLYDLITFEDISVKQVIVGNGGDPYGQSFSPYNTNFIGHSLGEGFVVRHSNTTIRPGYVVLDFGTDGLVKNLTMRFRNETNPRFYTVKLPYETVISKWQKK